jgi:hypothetical protein
VKETCEHGTPISEDCDQCRDSLARGSGLMDRYVALQAENTRLLNIIKGCPVCSELERNIKP